jgi:filamentous hemagglutinin family protein
LYLLKLMRQILLVAADVTLGLAVLLCAKSAIASPIIPANDNTQTTVIVNGDRIEINGGTRSGDGLNLFHSFEQFNLNTNQIADFLATPQLQNILGRVIGGDPSIINGLIQVSHGTANLYLMNPAGIVFGRDAALNVSGDFFATTATAIGFNGNSWFEAFGQNDYFSLTGNPRQFAFELPQPGAIINAGDLSVQAGRNLTLMGGNVVNTGNIAAPDGTILIQSVPGTNLVRLSQPGSLLSLEIVPPRDSNNQVSFTALELPSLLAGSSVETGLVVNADHSVETTAQTPVTGTTVTGRLIAANVDILGDRVSLVDTTRIEGDRVRIGGDYRGEGTIPNARNTFVGTNTEIESNDAIIWADDTTRFYGKISAPGGFVEVSGKENLIFRGDVDVSNGGQLLLDPENIIIVDAPSAADDDQLNDSQILQQDGTGDFTISRGRLESLMGSIILEATNNIIIEDLVSDLLNLQARDGDTVTFTADADNNGFGDFIMRDRNDTLQTNGGSLVITGSSIITGNLAITNTGAYVDVAEVLAGNVVGSQIELVAKNDIITGNLQSLPFYYDSNPSVTSISVDDYQTLGGEIRIESQNGSVQTSNIFTYTDRFENMGAPLEILAAENVLTGNLRVSSGNLDIVATTGDITVGFIRATSSLLDAGSTINIKTNKTFRSTNSFRFIYFDYNPVTGYYDVGISTEVSILTNDYNGRINIEHGGTLFATNTNVNALNPEHSGTQGGLLIVQGFNAGLIEIIGDKILTETTASDLIKVQFNTPPIATQNQLATQNQSTQPTTISSLPLPSQGVSTQGSLLSFLEIQILNIDADSSPISVNSCLGFNHTEISQVAHSEDWQDHCDEEILEIEETGYLPPHPSYVTLD